jgi:hypothetical protein
MQKMYTKIKKTQKIEKKCTQKYKKMEKNTQKLQKSHQKCQNDISGITDILPGVSPYWLSPITSFHHIGDNRYYRDILESVTSLTINKQSVTSVTQGGIPRAPVVSNRL